MNGPHNPDLSDADLLDQDPPLNPTDTAQLDQAVEALISVYGPRAVAAAVRTHLAFEDRVAQAMQTGVSDTPGFPWRVFAWVSQRLDGSWCSGATDGDTSLSERHDGPFWTPLGALRRALGPFSHVHPTAADVRPGTP